MLTYSFYSLSKPNNPFNDVAKVYTSLLKTKRIAIFLLDFFVPVGIKKNAELA